MLIYKDNLSLLKRGNSHLNKESIKNNQYKNQEIILNFYKHIKLPQMKNSVN